VNYLCFTSDGNNIVSVSNDNTIKVWDVKKGVILKEYQVYDTKGEEDYINDAVLSPDGRFVGIPLDTHLRIWDITTGIIQKLPFKDIYITGNAFFSLAFSHDSTRLAMSDGESICIWRKVGD